MLLKLKKKRLKNLSMDSKALPSEMTPNIAGGAQEDVIRPTTSTCSEYGSCNATISQASCIRSC